MSPGGIIITGLLIVAGGLAAANPAAVLPGMLIATLGLLSRVWTRHILSDVSCRVSLDLERCPPGQAVGGRIEIENDQPLPVPWLQCACEWPASVGSASGSSVLAAHHNPGRMTLRHDLSLRWFERVTRPFQALAHKRGEYFFGPAELRVEDPFGFFAGQKSCPGRARLLVLPRTVPVRTTDARRLSPFGEHARRSWIDEDPVRVRGAREYAPGDPFSRIEWKATARTGELHTRVLDASYASEVAFVINLATGQHLWEGIDVDAAERNLTIAASLVRAYCETRGRFSIHSNGLVRGLRGPATLALGAGAGHLHLAMDLLARLSVLPRGAIAPHLQRICWGLRDNAQVVLITPLIEEQLERVIRSERHRGTPLTLIITGMERPEARGYGAAVFMVAEKEPWDELAQITLTQIS